MRAIVILHKESRRPVPKYNYVLPDYYLSCVI